MVQGSRLCRGFVLTGGQSSRMGQDKALLPFGDRPLVVWIAERVRRVCEDVSLVGNPTKYAGLGFPAIGDVFPDQGPLSGIHAALVHSDARFTLVIGCDMPYLSPEFLELLLEIAGRTEADAVVPESESFRYEPLCAIYTRACLLPIEQALQQGQRKIRSLLERWRLRVVTRQEWEPYDPSGKMFSNLNTPADYEQVRAEWERSQKSEVEEVRIKTAREFFSSEF